MTLEEITFEVSVLKMHDTTLSLELERLQASVFDLAKTVSVLRLKLDAALRTVDTIESKTRHY